MRFSKYHGCQNDFIVVVGDELTPQKARHLCDRHAGIGADGVALLTLAKGLEPPRMRIINADGSQPEMCGNALRCVVKHLVDHGFVESPTNVKVMTDAGLLTAHGAIDDKGQVEGVEVDMGPPRDQIVARSVSVMGRAIKGHTVSMGNPHFVIESQRPLHDAKEFGLLVATHLDFPEGVNASFVRVMDKANVEAVVFERGAGLTMACGTGACAIAAVGLALGWFSASSAPPSPITVHLPGGKLIISRFPDGHLHMRGPAVWVFDGEL